MAESRKGLHPLAAGLIGAAAAATAVALSDERNREKVSQAFSDLRKRGEGLMGSYTSGADIQPKQVKPKKRSTIKKKSTE
jgi:hypothetical protein